MSQDGQKTNQIIQFHIFTVFFEGWNLQGQKWNLEIMPILFCAEIVPFLVFLDFFFHIRIQAVRFFQQ